MNPILNIAIRTARNAGNIISRSVDHVDQLQIDVKADNDFVTEIDRKAEQEIIYTIKKAYPDHAILAEESGDQKGDEHQWVIDPLDGTTNFLHGFPQFAVSIAFKHKGRLENAVVYDPLRQEIFSTTRSCDAQLNDRRIRVTNRKDLDNALLGTGFPFKAQQHLDAYMETFKALFPMTSGIRRAGSAALDLSYVAAGRLDGFWEIGLSEWDMAAGALLIQEAGGLLGDFTGGSNYLSSGNIVAGNPKVFKAILQKIYPHLTPELTN